MVWLLVLVLLALALGGVGVLVDALWLLLVVAGLLLLAVVLRLVAWRHRR